MRNLVLLESSFLNRLRIVQEIWESKCCYHLHLGMLPLEQRKPSSTYRFHILSKSVKSVSSQYEINIECENDILDVLVVCFCVGRTSFDSSYQRCILAHGKKLKEVWGT